MKIIGKYRIMMKKIIHEILYLGLLVLLLLMLLNNSIIVSSPIYAIYVISLLILFIRRVWEALKVVIYGPRYENDKLDEKALMPSVFSLISEVVSLVAAVIIIAGILHIIFYFFN